MNYFAHGRRFLDDPYFVAGTAVPDWLNVVNRRARVKTRHAAPFVEHADPRWASIARGVVQHHHDDQWFHGTRAFAELSLNFTVQVRDRLAADAGFRPSFLGHILVELLLDSELITRAPERLEAYYAALGTLDAEVVSEAVQAMAGKNLSLLAFFIPQFTATRFLADYPSDEKLLQRLNNVMRRVKLPDLPDDLAMIFPGARAAVRSRMNELLAGETQACAHEMIQRNDEGAER